MSIFILEDQNIQADILKALITKECGLLKHPKEPILTFSRGKDLLVKAKEETQLHIYFLDIQIKKELKGGFEVAKEIRQFDSKGLIVFVTSHSDLVRASYDYFVSALTFIEKNPNNAKFAGEIEESLRIYFDAGARTEDEDVFVCQTKATTVSVPFQDVYCVSSGFDHRVILEGRQQVREFYASLKEIEDHEPRLLRVHQSYLVNPVNVLEIDKSSRSLLLVNGKRIPVSRKYYKAVVRQLQGVLGGENG